VKKKNIIIWATVAIVILIGVVALWPKKESGEKEIISGDVKVVIPTQTKINYESETGAKQISLSESQYSEVYLIKDLRNKMPIDKDNFKMTYDYKINRFIVVYKNENGSTDFEKWLNETGYSGISKKFFQLSE